MGGFYGVFFFLTILWAGIIFPVSSRTLQGLGMWEGSKQAGRDVNHASTLGRVTAGRLFLQASVFTPAPGESLPTEPCEGLMRQGKCSGQARWCSGSGACLALSQLALDPWHPLLNPRSTEGPLL